MVLLGIGTVSRRVRLPPVSLPLLLMVPVLVLLVLGVVPPVSAPPAATVAVVVVAASLPAIATAVVGLAMCGDPGPY